MSKTIYRLYKILPSNRSDIQCIVESSDIIAVKVLKNTMLKGLYKDHELHNALFIVEFHEEIDQTMKELSRTLKSIIGELDRIQAERAMVAMEKSENKQ